MSEPITFWAYGTPRTKGSTRSFKAPNGAVITKGDNPRTKAWQGVIAHAAGEAGVRPLEGGVFVQVRYFFSRPKSHYGTGRNADKLKASAPALPTNRTSGDLDKLARALLDGLTGVAFVDDSEVTRITASKAYAIRGAREGACITVDSD